MKRKNTSRRENAYGTELFDYCLAGVCPGDRSTYRSAAAGAAMKLIIGGRNQGKTEFVRELAAELSSDKEKDPDKKGGNDSPSAISEADGRTSSFEAAMKAGVILHLECYIRRLMEAGKDPYLFAARLQEENPEALITADEIGCGIVPIDAFLREYRETDGRICQKLASFSEEVYRVMCGIGIRIK